MCGKRFSRQKDNFSFSQSPFFKGNNSYLPVCKSCIDSVTDQYTEKLGNQDEAIKRIALHWDMYVSDSLLSSTKKIDANRSRVSCYIKDCNLQQNTGKTYDTYLDEQKSNTINSIEEFEKLKSEDTTSVSDRTFKRWGTGFSDVELTELDRHYKMLKDLQISADDVVQDIQIRSACEQHIMKLRTREKDPDKYIKFVESYNKTLEKAGLKSKANIRDSLNEGAVIVGKWIDDIENHCPAEFYSDKKKYYDFFDIKEYIERFLYRPLKNLLLGTKEKDFEFNIDNTQEVEVSDNEPENE